MPSVTYQTSGKTIEVEQDANLLRTSIRYEGSVPYKCGGGLCGTCRVQIVDGHEHLSKIMKRKSTDSARRSSIKASGLPVRPSSLVM